MKRERFEERITARLDELSTRLSAIERLLLQALSRLPPG